MPPPRDLTGQRFGALTVLRPAPDHPTASRPRQWHCRCACGVELDVLHRRLVTHIVRRQQHSCDACRVRQCEICGGPVSASSSARTCSAECAGEHSRRYQLAYYHSKRSLDPIETEARRLRAQARWARLSPEEKLANSRKRKASEDREHVNARARKYYARRMADPEYAARRAEQAAAWEAANKEKSKLYSRIYSRKKRMLKKAREIGAFIEQIGEPNHGD